MLELDNATKIQNLRVVAAWAKKILRRTFRGNNLIPCVPIEVVDSGIACDPHLQIGGFQVLCDTETLRAIGGDKEVMTFIIGYVNVIPGCHTLPNGDPGYPDDEDFVEKTSTRSPGHAASIAVGLDLATKVTGMWEWMEEEKMMREMEQDEV